VIDVQNWGSDKGYEEDLKKFDIQVLTSDIGYKED